jgi:hypothetical protein
MVRYYHDYRSAVKCDGRESVVKSESNSDRYGWQGGERCLSRLVVGCLGIDDDGV